jgi:DNA-directed RNA polymerase sigma subunit (sigma70/sigma32)
MMLMTKLTPKNMAEVLREMRLKRDEEIRGLYKSYKDNPLTGWTIEKIAQEYGITKQRVWQIIEGK